MKYQGVRYRCQVIELIDKEIAESIVNNLEKRYYSDGEIQNMILQKLLEKQSFETFEDTLKYMASLQKHEMFNRFLKHILDKYDFSSIYKKINSSEFKILSGYFYDEIGVCPSCEETFLKTKSSIVYCSSKCSNSADEVKKKKEVSCLKHYGTKNHTQSKVYQSELVERNQEKYGVNFFTETQDFKNKSKATKLKRYGDECFINVEKAKKTRIEKTSNDPNYVKNIVSKRKKTCLEKYGVESATMSEKVKEKGRKSFLKNIERIRSSNLKRYINKVTEGNCVTFEEARNYLIKKYNKQNKFDIQALSDTLSICTAQCLYIKKRFGIDMDNYQHHIVASKAQMELYNWIQADDKILNCRKLIYPYEVDIYIPSIKLAIEYNGVYWHSEKYHDKEYHLNKTIDCLAKGVQLFHIFEFEDIEIWKSMINNKLGLNKKIYARKCIIKEIDHTTAKVFCEQNHLQGYVSSSIRLGLFYEDKLVQVMTFGKPRFNKNYDYELLRLCSLKGVNVVGGASKLFKHFLRNHKSSIISYADLRYSSGKIYDILGFKVIKTLDPRCIFSNASASKVIYDESQYNGKILKMYDCGKTVYGCY